MEVPDAVDVPIVVEVPIVEISTVKEAPVLMKDAVAKDCMTTVNDAMGSARESR